MNTETKIIFKLVTNILSCGLPVSVFDGEDWVLKRSKNWAEIQAAVGGKDTTKLVIGDQLGWFLLVHGNGADVISDYEDNELCDDILEDMLP